MSRDPRVIQQSPAFRIQLSKLYLFKRIKILFYTRRYKDRMIIFARNMEYYKKSEVNFHFSCKNWKKILTQFDASIKIYFLSNWRKKKFFFMDDHLKNYQKWLIDYYGHIKNYRWPHQKIFSQTDYLFKKWRKNILKQKVGIVILKRVFKWMDYKLAKCTCHPLDVTVWLLRPGCK